MKRGPVLIVAGFLLALAAFIAFRGAAPSKPAPTKEERPPRSMTQTPHGHGRAPSELDPLVLQLCAASDRARLVQSALEIRNRARTDKDFMRSLFPVLLDAGQPAHVREVLAFVLGNLPDAEAQKALRDALEQGGEPGWIKTLVLAIGSARDDGRDDAFDNPDGPWVHRTPSGLSVIVRTVLLDEAPRKALQQQLDHSDTEVRRAVLQSLQHTLIYEARSRREGQATEVGDVRLSFLRELDGDADESVRAEAGRALSEWMVTAPESSSGHSDVVQSVLKKSLDPQEDQVRFRTLQGLKQTELVAGDVSRIADLAVREGDFERRAWAIELSAARAESLESSQRQALMAVAANDRDPKIREIALRQFSQYPASNEASELIRHCFSDSEWNVRFAAVRAMAQQAPSRENIEALQNLGVNDPNEDVRKAALQSLKVLQR